MKSHDQHTTCLLVWAYFSIATVSDARAMIRPMPFPAAVPEIPATSIEKAAAYYVNTLGFTFDWGDEQGGIAGISRGDCRLFITNCSFRESYGNIGPILFWLNLESRCRATYIVGKGVGYSHTLRS